MRPSQALNLHRERIREIALRHRVAGVSVFGSAIHGDDDEGSDLDLLVAPLPGTTQFDLGGLQEELEELMGLRVDVRTPKDLPPTFRAQVLAEARPV